MDHYGTALELKTVDISQRLLSGHAAAHSNVDRVRDIIDPAASVKAMARITNPGEQVAVFIGHQHHTLPVGIARTIQATDRGLYTETKVFEGPAGDNLLAVAKELLANGLALGISIGYQTQASKPERVEGKTIRRIMDYTLKEYSFAASQSIANPLALVTGVKTDETAPSRDGSMTDVHDLPDSSFLLISPGGVRDDEGKTTPRSLRHLPYKDAEGTVDPEHLRAAIAAIPTLIGLDAEQKSLVGARARKLLEDAEHGAPADEGAEWKTGAPVSIRALGYTLLDLSESAAGELKAMRLLGEDTKDNLRMRDELRTQLAAVRTDITSMLSWADTLATGADGEAEVALLRTKLALLQL